MRKRKMRWRLWRWRRQLRREWGHQDQALECHDKRSTPELEPARRQATLDSGVCRTPLAAWLAFSAYWRERRFSR